MPISLVITLIGRLRHGGAGVGLGRRRWRWHATSPERKRLRTPDGAARHGPAPVNVPIADVPSATFEGASSSMLPTSPTDLVAACAGGWPRPATKSTRPRSWYSAVRFVLPVSWSGSCRSWCSACRGGWVLGLASAALGVVMPDLLARAEDREIPEGHSGRPAGRARPDRRLHRGGIEPRPGHREGQRRTGDRASGDRPRAEDAVEPDPGGQAPHGGVSGSREANRRGRCPIAGGDADPDRSLRHQHRAGPAHAGRHPAVRSAGSAPKSGPARSA